MRHRELTPEVRAQLRYVNAGPGPVDLGRFPDFFIAGPQRTGTTWLHANKRFHPQVYLSEPKEIYFFSRLKTLDNPKYQSYDLELANNYVYNMARPFDNDSDSINSICGPFTMVKPIARVPEIKELLNDQTPALQTVEQADVYAGNVSSLSKVVHDGTRYCVCGLVNRPTGEGNKYQQVIVFLISTDGSAWTTSAEYVPDNVPAGFNSSASSCDNLINGFPNIRYIASDGFYATYSQQFSKPNSYIQRSISVILKSTDGTNWLRFADRTVEMDRTNYNEMYDVYAVPDICKDASNYYATMAGRIIKIASDGTQTQVFPPTNADGNLFQWIVWNGTNLVAISRYCTRPDARGPATSVRKRISTS